MARKILVSWAMPEVGREVLRKAKVEAVFIHVARGGTSSPKEFMKKLLETDVLLPRTAHTISRSLMTINPRLRGIANYGVGFNNIDVRSATEFGIPVTNTPDVLTETTADLAWALLMATARRIPQGHLFVRSGGWEKFPDKILWGLDIGPGGSNTPKVLGIIGFGRIGRAVMRRSRGFKMKVMAYDPYFKGTIEKTRGVEYQELYNLLKQSDFVTIHTPLTQDTHHLIGKDELDLMKSSAILINTSRGPVVDEKALVSALKKRKIAAAGLDVFEKEPKLAPGLAKLDNAVLLPHVGSATEDTRGQMAVVAAKNAVAMLKGKRPSNIVNPEVLESAEYRRRLGQ
jgi:lactate dehydrogenase-like 2-hydroxyacid dehydrogenase